MTERAQKPADAAHRFAVRVYYEDTDAGGIVYYANYLKFAERARTEMLREIGAPYVDLVRDGLSLAVRRCEVEYLRPARLDDRLEVETRLLDVGGATLKAEQDVRREDELLAQLRIRLACISRTGQPARLPLALRNVLKPYCRVQ